ncbi:VOC family protein [Nocardia sp. NPDC059240]|uniref:VOC family protein n=1 Tax=Nocardia sp. NPDC059240 TaxID=3346786 RepID=UPI0036BC595A
MISGVAIVNVLVADQEESKRFYIDVLGFEERDDVQISPGYRWCTVGHPSQPELLVSLVRFGPPLTAELARELELAQKAGGLGGLGLNVDDCHQTYADLKGKGVEFVQEPVERPYGTEAVCRDNSGNWMVLIEPRPTEVTR